jgi:hypothetical protein
MLLLGETKKGAIAKCAKTFDTRLRTCWRSACWLGVRLSDILCMYVGLNTKWRIIDRVANKFKENRDLSTQWRARLKPTVTP